MKTEEERKELRTEAEDMSSRLAELSEDELEQVAGGDYRPIPDQGQIFLNHVGQYNGVIGQKYYFVADHGEEWFYGILLDSYEKDMGVGTERTHKVRLLINNGWDCSAYAFEREFYGCHFSMYTDCLFQNVK